MKTTTQRDSRHPWNYFKVMEEKMKKILTGKSNENLMALLEQAKLDVPVGRKRKDIIDVLLAEWALNYRIQFKELHGFTLESTKDPKQFKRHFRKFKWQVRLIQFIEFLKKLNPFKKTQPKIIK